MIQKISDDNIKRGEGKDQYIPEALNTGGLLIVKADWCGHCKAVLPILEKVSSTLGMAYPIFSLDADANPDSVAKLGVRGFPSIFHVDRSAKISKPYQGGRSYEDFLSEICKVSLVCRK